tara:strand:- start:742 stop:1851 length:1110 start_codon:yes stop_codon:yes gene_type:complete
MKEVLIVGSGVSAWSAAIVFAKKNIKVRVLSKNDEVFGAQQLSPSGFNYLNELIDKNFVKKNVEKILQVKITSINKNKFTVLTNFNLQEKFNTYNSISRRVLIKLLKESAQKNNNIEVINEKANFLLKKNAQSIQVLTCKGNILESDLIIGADGQNGICRKYVCGSDKKNLKKIFRLVIEDNKLHILSKNLLQIFLSDKGHFVVYPFNINNKKFVNYVFVPNKSFEEISNSNNIPQYHPLIKVSGWKMSLINKNTEIKNNFWKNNLLLFGDAAFPIEPHLAQGGNQIFKDAVFLKKNLTKSNKIEDIVQKFLDERIEEKISLQNKASIFGKILGFQNILSLSRNLFISKYSKKFINDFFEPIWNNNVDS